ncbi:MAG: hypothetical protein M1834_008035 [Cirrosporium novae-zelandiae]|nr:MAG: hypothetical protein M1834_008035 [Cirrosporium novae-zelandiae]
MDSTAPPGPDVGDPFEWSPDIVRSRLCEKTSPIHIHATDKNLIIIKEAFKLNDVDGFTLLTEIVDRSTVKDGLGINSIGVASHLLHRVRQLQAQSTKFSEYISNPDNDLGLSANNLPADSADTSVKRVQPTLVSSYNEPRLLETATNLQSRALLSGPRQYFPDCNESLQIKQFIEDYPQDKHLIKYLKPSNDDEIIESGYEESSDSEEEREFEEILQYDASPSAAVASSQLTNEQIKDIADREDSRMVEVFREAKLAKLEYHAHGIWMQSRQPEFDLEGRKTSTRKSIQICEQRLANIRQNFALDSTVEELEETCGAMEPDIFAREHNRLLLSILESEACPEPKSRASTAFKYIHRRTSYATDEERLTSDSEEESEYTNDSYEENSSGEYSFGMIGGLHESSLNDSQYSHKQTTATDEYLVADSPNTFITCRQDSQGRDDYESGTSSEELLKDTVLSETDLHGIKSTALLSKKRRQDSMSSTHDDSSTSSSDSSIVNDSPHKKRKREVKENQRARSIRFSNKERVKEQEDRRRTLIDSMKQNSEGQSTTSEVIINPGKLETEGLVILNPWIGKRIKAHQIEGVQFLWREIMAGSGALLSHTMGLGKTMQVISLLVTIAECASSEDPSVRNLIPNRLLKSRTLVLCPSTLIENWWDEFIIWTPPLGGDRNLGTLRKLDSRVTRVSHRLEEVDAWFREGGILIMSYDLLRLLVENKTRDGKDPQLNEEQHQKILKQLLEGPNVIVADEAHKIKNKNTGIAKAAAKFQSPSRIALTGSPLSNHLIEYYAMIDWIEPGYLGNEPEFCSRYVEPITEGMYSDSTAVERRKHKIRLDALKKELAPKVHRADITVLKGQIPAKTEFVVTVPFTALQGTVYGQYINARDSKINMGMVWSCLNVLKLLCNHPFTFWSKYLAKATEPAKVLKIPDDSVSKIREEFLQHPMTTSPESFLDYSYKCRVLNYILKFSSEVGDKVLIFSHSIDTLNYLEQWILNENSYKLMRLDGSTQMSLRQESTKAFNEGDCDVFLISTSAGALGLNLTGANRVVLFDIGFNPTVEEQAIGRAYRIGQEKPTYVYTLLVGGSFEEIVYWKALLKSQLTSRVVDKRSPLRFVNKNDLQEMMAPPRAVDRAPLDEFAGKDPFVLDKLIKRQTQGILKDYLISSLKLSEINEDEDDQLTQEEEKEASQFLKEWRSKKEDPKILEKKRSEVEWANLVAKRFGRAARDTV